MQRHLPRHINRECLVEVVICEAKKRLIRDYLLSEEVLDGLQGKQICLLRCSNL